MNKIIFSCVILIFIFHLMMGDKPNENDSTDELETWKKNANKNMKDAFECLQSHYGTENSYQYDEQFGDVKFYELRKCSKNDSSIDETEKKIAESMKQCSVDLTRKLEENLTSLNKIDSNYVSSSRDEMDRCLKDFWTEWIPPMFKLTEVRLTCLSKIREFKKPTAEEISKKRNDPDFKNYCVIENGILLNKTQ